MGLLQKIFFLICLIISNECLADPVQSVQHGNIVYFLESSPNEILRYDINQSRWLDKVSLPVGETTKSIAVHPSGIFVAFERIVYRYSHDGSTRVHIVNTAQLIKELVIINQILFINQNGSYYEEITTVNIDTLNINIHKPPYPFSPCNGSSVAPSLNRSFCLSGYYPSDIHYNEFDNVGNLVRQEDSPYHGDYPRSSKSWMFPDEARVVDNEGIVFETGDLKYLGSFGEGFSAITFVRDVPVVLRENKITAYTQALLEAGTYTFSSSPSVIFSSDTKVFSFFLKSDGYDVNSKKLSDFSIAVVGTPVNPEYLSYTPDAIEYDSKEGILYFLSNLHLSIFRWSLSEEKYLSTISLMKVPSYFTLDDKKDLLYLANPDGQIRKIDLSNSIETHLTTLPQNPLGLEMAGDYLFAVDPSGAWNSHYTIDASSGVTVSNIEWNYYSKKYIYSSVNNKMYFFRDDTSPNDLLWEEISSDSGTIGIKKDSPYHGDYKISHPIRIAPDGRVVLIGSGVFFNADTLQYANSLSNEISDAIWLDDVLVTIKKSSQPTIQTWSPRYAPIKDIGFKGEAVRLFSYKDKIVFIRTVSQKLDIKILSISDLSHDDDSDTSIDKLDNCPSIKNLDQSNLDQDSLGDVCDADIDGDGIPNDFETQISSDPYNASDGELDFDNDGVSNIDEYINGTNPLDGKSSASSPSIIFLI